MKIEDCFGISEHPKFARLHVHISILVYIHVDLANIIYILCLLALFPYMYGCSLVRVLAVKRLKENLRNKN